MKIIRGVHATLDNEAIRTIQAMPKWKAGEQRGRKVGCSYTLLINFKLMP